MTARSLRVEPLKRSDHPTVRDAVFELFRAYGLTTIFGNPGSTELPMFRDMPEDFRYILGLQESVVLGMADGYAQATGNAAVVNLHSSAGVGHALGNLFTAFRNGTPLVVTAGQQARSILPFEPFLYAERPTEFPRPFVKWAIEPARAEDVPLAIMRAYHTAMQAPQGPVFVSIPIDDWEKPAQPIKARRASTKVAPDADLLAEAAAMLAKARKPVIVGGQAVANNRARDALVQLAERHHAPVWAAPMCSRNVFPEDHKLFGGFLSASREAVVRELGDPDLVLVLGAPAFTYHVEGFGPFVPEGAELIQIVDDPSMAARAPEGLSIVGDVKTAVLGLLDGPAPGPRGEPAPRPVVADPDPTRLTDGLLMKRLDALRPKGIAITEEAPSTRGPMHDFFPIYADEEFHACASGGLGHGMPAGVGVALGREGTVLTLMGDGSSMYSIQSLWTAAQLDLDIKFVVVNNGAYAALEQFGRLFQMEVVGSKLPEIDFVKIAEGQGVPAERVTEAGELDAAITRLFAEKGPRLIEVVVQPE